MTWLIGVVILAVWIIGCLLVWAFFYGANSGRDR